MSQKENTQKSNNWFTIFWLSILGIIALASVVGGFLGGQSHEDLQKSKKEFVQEHYSEHFENQSPDKDRKGDMNDET